ncbi:MAG: isoprenyl transferase [Limnochordia bacterium]|jgi:undecaprenyl diphosphate synthase
MFNRLVSWFQGRGKPLTLDKEKLPTHLALIMDGNGRWAQSKGLPRTAGHSVGVETLKKIVEYCGQIGIPIITAYTFSTENWRRPRTEVDFLMELLATSIDEQLDDLRAKGVQIRVIGNWAALPPAVANSLRLAIEKTKANQRLILNLAINYGGRAEIVEAVRKISHLVEKGDLMPDQIDEELVASFLQTKGLPDPDLIIRTGGDLRLSNFLLWQAAYSELWVTPTHWPAFTVQELTKALGDYQSRERRFGKIKSTSGE